MNTKHKQPEEKKQSAYMTPEEVETHLTPYKTYTSKIGYIHDMLERKTLLSPLTQASLYRVVDKLQRRRKEIYNDIDMEVYNLIGDCPLRDSARIYEERGEIEQAAECYEVMGTSDYDGRKVVWKGDLFDAKEARKLYSQAGNTSKVSHLTELINSCLEFEARGDEMSAERHLKNEHYYLRKSCAIDKLERARKKYIETQNSVKCRELNKVIRSIKQDLKLHGEYGGKYGRNKKS